jgi:hypothetical protein
MPASSQNLERYLWPLFWAALLTYFIQSLLHDTPLYPYRLGYRSAPPQVSDAPTALKPRILFFSILISSSIKKKR